MGFLSRLLSNEPLTPAPAQPQFEVDIDSGVLYGAPSLDDYIFRTGRITRAEALRVPAVKRARDLICGTIGQFPLIVKDPKGKPDATFTPNLFQQPEPGTPSSVTWTRVVEDMLLFERAWMRGLSYGWHGRIIEARRLDADSVTVVPEYKHFPEGMATVWPEVKGLIRFDSPNGGLLDCAPAIRACIALERATLNYVDGAPPVDYFTPVEGADPFESDEEAEAFLNKWTEGRRKRSTAFVPDALEYHTGGWDPEKLQLASAREQAILEVARITGIDAEELSVPVTSRTYSNMQDRRRSRIEDVLGPYMTAIEQRLSMDDITPRGYCVAFDTTSYLRLDDLSSAQADEALVGAQILTRDDARAKRGLEPLGQPEPVTEPAPEQERQTA